MADENGAYAACVTKRGPINSDLEICNDPSKFKRTTVKFNSDLPGVNNEVKGFGISSKIAWKGAYWNLLTEGIIYNKFGINDEIPVYIAGMASDLTSPDAMDLVTNIIALTDRNKILAFDHEGNPILDENGEQYFYYVDKAIVSPGIFHESSDTFMCIDSYGFDIEEFPEESFLLPYDKVFSYKKSDDMLFFSEAPIMSITPDSYFNPEIDYSRFDFYPKFYYPCLSSYDLPYSYSVSFNGNKIVGNAKNDEFDWQSWSVENYKQGGVFDISMQAQYKPNDPEAILTNQLHIDTSKEDYSPAKVTLWQLKDSEGKISNSASGKSYINLLCQEDSNEDFDLTVSCPQLPDYKFEVEKISQVPFWDGTWQMRRTCRIDLADFPGEKGKKYSLEFSTKDASGNTSTQTIGNAFTWDSATGVETISGEKREIWYADGELHAPADAEVYTLTGIRADTRNLLPGLYLVKTPRTTAKIIVP